MCFFVLMEVDQQVFPHFPVSGLSSSKHVLGAEVNLIYDRAQGFTREFGIYLNFELFNEFSPDSLNLNHYTNLCLQY